MDDAHYAILLLILGLGMLIAEVFIPTGGILGLLVAACLVGSIWCAWSAWWETSPTIWWSYITVVLLLVPITIVGAFYVLPRTSFGQEVLLSAPDSDDVRPYVKEQELLAAHVGHTGETLTPLNPGGMVLVEGERFHCESEGILVEPNTEVRVIGVSGLRLLVRPRSLEENPFVEEDFSGVDNPPLDFDIPQS